MSPGLAEFDTLESLSFADAPRILVMPPGPGSRRLLARQAARESNARTYPRGIPIAPAEARGATIRDVDGNLYIDCLAGAGALSVGHNNPFVVAAVASLLEAGHVVSGLDFPTEPKDRFVEALFEILPEPLRQHGRIQFCGPTGSDAADAAIKLAKTATGRREIVAFRGAYHGMGLGPLSLMGATAPKQALGALMPGVHFMPFANCGQCPLRLVVETCEMACAHLLGSALEDPYSGITRPAAIIVEAIQGEAGTIVPPPGWLKQIADYAREYDVPLICDEIQSGLGRTGRWFAFEHEEICPDVILLSKALGGLGLPLSVIVYHERLDLWAPGAHAGTFRGNQLAMAASVAAIEFIRSRRLVEHAARLGERIMSALREGLGGSDQVIEIRGKGLMIGIEMISAPIASAVRRECLDRGLIVEVGGRRDCTLRLLPPLVLTEALAERVVEILISAARCVSASRQDLRV